ncbi:MAG: pantoate--beta-alanine ligase [Gammaproteobacteria bacterium]|nr:MAG: pantoate--beta-alanine ligase [Gammaproteobacteria bacterium]UCH40213.1 MAG: pantoate--beta-alanine ligase [Gammaproteobacteria bacterium]
MDQATSVIELRQYVQHWKDHGHSIAFIPTMGNLHAGHMSLIEKGQALCDRSICSIFVNPMQFGPNEDWDHYPRTLESDIEKLEAVGCDLVYLPAASELYPEGLDRISQVQVTDLTDNYEGKHRPGHFTGVATVVLKLFNIVKPDVSVFGKKDYQQYRVISKMVEDFNLDVQIIGQETTREPSGLASSSRNQYLDATQLETAAMIYRQLQQTAQQIEQGARDFDSLEKTAIENLDGAGFTTDYFAICNAETLQPASADDRNLVILVTAAVGQTRLLDNIEISLW